MKKQFLLFTLVFLFTVGNILAQPVVTEEFAYTVGNLLTAEVTLLIAELAQMP